MDEKTGVDESCAEDPFGDFIDPVEKFVAPRTLT